MSLKSLSALFGFALLVTWVCGSVYYWTARRAIAAGDVVSVCEELRGDLERATSLVVNGDVGVTDYIRTGQAAYLRPYAASLSQFISAQSRLKDLTRDDPVERRRVLGLEKEISDALDQLGSFPALGVPARPGIKKKLDAIHGAANEELQILSSYRSKEKLFVDRTILAASAGGVSAVALLFLAFFVFFKREISEKTKQGNLLASALHDLGEGVVAADESGRFTVFNPMARQIMGEGDLSDYPKDWAKNHGVYYPDKTTLVKVEDLPMVCALRGKSTDGAEFFIKNAENPEGIFISVTGRPLMNKNGKRVGGVVVLSNITSKKVLQEQMEGLNRKLLSLAGSLTQSNKELEAFSYSVAHDLRAPLRAIEGFSHFLIEDYSDRLGEQGKDYLNRIGLGCQRMGQLIDDLLALANVTRQEIKSEKTDLREIAKSVIEKIEEAEPNRRVEFSVPVRIEAFGDPGLLKIVLENLIGNAWKFTSKTENARIEIGSTQKDGETAYFVKDNGAGFDMKYVDKIFDPFQRLHSQSDFPGQGLGLAIVSRIVHRHGGRIWAEGEVGKGAALYFTLGGVERGGLNGNQRWNDTSSGG